MTGESGPSKTAVAPADFNPIRTTIGEELQPCLGKLRASVSFCCFKLPSEREISNLHYAKPFEGSSSELFALLPTTSKECFFKATQFLEAPQPQRA